ncbi:MAG: AraC family transcriptional regulator [Opitutae bacterium]|jgi:AraC-like DNA-binding protein|nr:AraC family transcriptional regulator [Opitutae bacterium]MBT5380497.1 AraC family transcriptional regulator [Opitutae bacterium]MBT5690433.1 AraC family transcriptional regulator [Opitutae bacterium]
MSKSDIILSETDIRTVGSEQTILRSSIKDKREWIMGSPVCTSLSRHQILHLGVARMLPPFEIVRSKLGGSYFLAGLSGEGRVLVDGRWKKCLSGQAFLLHPGTMHAFCAEKGKPWSFCWVRFQDDTLSPPVAEANSPVLASFDGETFRHAILGLHKEATTRTRPEMETLWLGLVNRYINDFAKPQLLDSRLLWLFEKVEDSLGEAWNNRKMARVACLGERQLERLCLRQLGRTPRQHLIWLRMHRAAILLSSTNQKIEPIAFEVGYANPFAFSSTFRRCMGWSPSNYPGRLAG